MSSRTSTSLQEYCLSFVGLHLLLALHFVPRSPVFSCWLFLLVTVTKHSSLYSGSTPRSRSLCPSFANYQYVGLEQGMLSPLAQLTVISGAVERDDMHYFQVLYWTVEPANFGKTSYRILQPSGMKVSNTRVQRTTHWYSSSCYCINSLGSC